MQNSRQYNHKNKLKLNIINKEPSKYNSIFNKLKLDQMLTTRRPSSFATTHDFFQTNYAFMPNSAAISPDRLGQQRKEKFKLYRTLKLPDFDSYSRLIRWQPQTKNKSSKNKLHKFSARHQTISFFRTTSVTPSKRNQLNYKVRKVQQVSSFLQKQQSQSEQPQENITKQLKSRSYRIKQRFNWKSQDVQEQTLTGWNMRPLMFQTQIQVL